MQRFRDVRRASTTAQRLLAFRRARDRAHRGSRHRRKEDTSAMPKRSATCWRRGTVAAAIVLVCLAARISGASRTPWPPLLGSREAFPPDVSTAVERVWTEPTLSRTIHGPPARVPLDVYV